MDELVVRKPERDGEHGRNSLAYDVLVPLRPEVFAEELHALLNASDDPPPLVFEDEDDETIILWTLDGTVHIEHIKTVLANHSPEAPVVTDGEFVQSVLSRPEDHPLTAAETSRAIRLLLARTNQE